jgi:hypothetical protein
VNPAHGWGPRDGAGLSQALTTRGLGCASRLGSTVWFHRRHEPPMNKLCCMRDSNKKRPRVPARRGRSKRRSPEDGGPRDGSSPYPRNEHPPKMFLALVALDEKILFRQILGSTAKRPTVPSAERRSGNQVDARQFSELCGGIGERP